MRAEQYKERRIDIGRWQVRLSSYRINGAFYCHADNVSPGATLARTSGETRDEAEKKAVARAEQLLDRTRVNTA
jgi:hypothetical protein